jgi:hypothetical protein
MALLNWFTNLFATTQQRVLLSIGILALVGVIWVILQAKRETQGGQQ